MTEECPAWPSSARRDGAVTPVLNKLRRGGFTPNNPFMLRNIQPTRPRFSENDFLIGDIDDYDEDDHKFPWVPATRPSFYSSHAKELPGLEHILEDQLSPVGRQLKARRPGKLGSDMFSRKAVLGNKRKNKGHIMTLRHSQLKDTSMTLRHSQLKDTSMTLRHSQLKDTSMTLRHSQLKDTSMTLRHSQLKDTSMTLRHSQLKDTSMTLRHSQLKDTSMTLRHSQLKDTSMTLSIHNQRTHP
ncbi:uncharacterized protein LOC125027870 [Penaeus chinensis]|uniref:uncharacterized protein LOC125027870 n=1 Tax=Penaeus chinensis TaxID=139456 RepID=UPI001FB6CE30|nr:uncharacterized protein LOC125027870 [Penaeus chinensis]